MKFSEFLNLIGGEFVLVHLGNVNNNEYEADKNAIRAYREDLLDRELINVSIATKNKFEVLLK